MGMTRIIAALISLNLAAPCLAGEEPKGVVQIFQCDGRQVIVIVPKGSESDVPGDPCRFAEKNEQPAPFICVEGTCFPRSFVVVPSPPPQGKGRPSEK